LLYRWQSAPVAAPDRKVIALSGDGSAMYTIQSLWTLARENLDVSVVIFANNSYRILDIEMSRTGSGATGPQAAKLLGLGHPSIDWVPLARSMGVSAVRCETAEEFDKAFAIAMLERGPVLIEAVIA
jgi:acetolactate synthase-1/2/3 large subunit